MARQRFRRGRAWRRIRRQVLERDDYRCRKCKRAVGEKGEVHHVVPIAAGGTDQLSNLMLYCQKCHIEHHAGPLYQKRKAWREDTEKMLRAGY